MTFYSILYEKSEDSQPENVAPPSFFHDLNLDKVIDSITSGRDEYNLKPLFYTYKNQINTVIYRQEIMQDLENIKTFEYIKIFTQEMQATRTHITMLERLHYQHQKEAWLLEAIERYCHNILYLRDGLSKSNIRSRGLRLLSEYLKDYTTSTQFIDLLNQTKKIKSELSTTEYTILIKDNRLVVDKYKSEPDYSLNIERTFEKFKKGAMCDYITKFTDRADRMDHVEAKILDFVSELYPEVFAKLHAYFESNINYIDNVIARFDREVQVYLSYHEYIVKLKKIGLKFSYPELTSTPDNVYCHNFFDIALAEILSIAHKEVILNDLDLRHPERIMVVSGPNQGGKTTFARTFGQMHYFARMGLPSQGSNAKLYFFDDIYTHFEKEENIDNMRGKLQDDLINIQEIIKNATPSSIIIFNEIFTSTTLNDAVILSKKIMEKIIPIGALCVWVTFIDELSLFSKETVSLVSTVVPGNPDLRTFKIVRSPANGLSYAIAIAKKYQLTYDCLMERINL